MIHQKHQYSKKELILDGQTGFVVGFPRGIKDIYGIKQKEIGIGEERIINNFVEKVEKIIINRELREGMSKHCLKEIETGKFNRRPMSKGLYIDDERRCTWSRDMGLGLDVYAYTEGDDGLIKDHVKYGSKHFWKMGDPLNDGRVLYTPQMIGLQYLVRYYFTRTSADLTKAKYYGETYPSGLDDYQAHLQMLQIFVRSEINTKTGQYELVPHETFGENLTVSDTMYRRILEHSDREPLCEFYFAMRARYSDGDLMAIQQMLDSDMSGCSFVRCNDSMACHIAEKLFTAKVIRNWMNGR
jgi:hypothetical protein